MPHAVTDLANELLHLGLLHTPVAQPLLTEALSLVFSYRDNVFLSASLRSLMVPLAFLAVPNSGRAVPEAAEMVARAMEDVTGALRVVEEHMAAAGMGRAPWLPREEDDVVQGDVDMSAAERSPVAEGECCVGVPLSALAPRGGRGGCKVGRRVQERGV